MAQNLSKLTFKFRSTVLHYLREPGIIIDVKCRARFTIRQADFRARDTTEQRNQSNKSSRGNWLPKKPRTSRSM